MRITGKCHCGNVAFNLEWEGERPEIPARACTCSFCLKHGGVWTSNPGSTLEVVVRDPSLISKYAFGTKTAEFHVCSRCGVVPLVTSQVEGHIYAVVNVNTFENVEPSLLRRATANFEGEEIESRLARRRHNWIADVRFSHVLRPPSEELPMSLKHVLGSCHCGAVRYEADVDLSNGTIRCNCSICTKARAWFTFVGGEQFHLLAGEGNMSSYQWTPPGRPSPLLTYRFCKTCGVRIYGTGDAEFMGGKFYAVAVATFDNVTTDELVAAPLRFIDNRHDRFDRAPQDTRLM